RLQGDWSSDVCSSDLDCLAVLDLAEHFPRSSASGKCSARSRTARPSWKASRKRPTPSTCSSPAPTPASSSSKSDRMLSRLLRKSMKCHSDERGGAESLLSLGFCRKEASRCARETKNTNRYVAEEATSRCCVFLLRPTF